MTYHLTLLHTTTQNTLEVDIEQKSAFDAQKVAEKCYEGYQVIRISNTLSAHLTADSTLTEGALGDY